jgi:hypothetical protein
MCFALAIDGNNIYVGGQFSATGDGSVTSLKNVARFDSNAETWHALHNGLNGTVYALAIRNDYIYVGGDFTKSSDGLMTLNHIACYNLEVNAFYDTDKMGVNDTVYAFAALGDYLYVGGRFTATGDGTLLNLGRIARLDGYDHMNTIRKLHALRMVIL